MRTANFTQSELRTTEMFTALWRYMNDFVPETQRDLMCDAVRESFAARMPAEVPAVIALHAAPAAVAQIRELAKAENVFETLAQWHGDGRVNAGTNDAHMLACVEWYQCYTKAMGAMLRQDKPTAKPTVEGMGCQIHKAG